MVVVVAATIHLICSGCSLVTFVASCRFGKLYRSRIPFLDNVRKEQEAHRHMGARLHFSARQSHLVPRKAQHLATE